MSGKSGSSQKQAMRLSDCLIIVDVQNDFCPGGTLAVKDGDEVVPVVNRLQQKFDLIVATQDWHPANHKSFASNNQKKPGEVIILGGSRQIMWPDHCVQETRGARFAKGLKMDSIARVFRKGTDPEIDSYSGFFDNGHKKSTGLGDYLKKKSVRAVYVAGLATDYCVKYTALDAKELGFETFVIRDAVRAVNLKKGDASRALREMKKKGIRIIDAKKL